VAEERLSADTLSKAFIAVAQQCDQDSELWFPKSHNLTEHVLSMGGEVGEVQNITKKILRGSLDLNDASTRFALIMENTDVLIYNMNVAAILRYDPYMAYMTKRMENEKRFARG
jgi:hypothetical protein